MKNIVTVAAAAAVAAILASTPGCAKADTSLGAEQSAQQVASHFNGQGPWFVADSLGAKDATDAAEQAGVVLGVLGLGGVALLTLIRMQAESRAQRAYQAIRR